MPHGKSRTSGDPRERRQGKPWAHGRAVEQSQAKRMKRNHLFRALLSASLVTAGALPAQAQFARLSFTSQPGDPIGGGQTCDITYTPGNSESFYATVRKPGPTEIVFNLGYPDLPYTVLFFGTDQLGIRMQPGFYPNAERADFATPGHPGLDVIFDHRGCAELTGNFTIHEITYVYPRILSFSASFEQHASGIQPALFGTFTYQAIPEPSVLNLLTLLLAGLLCVRRNR
jgi:hypothetical protein